MYAFASASASASAFASASAMRGLCGTHVRPVWGPSWSPIWRSTWGPIWDSLVPHWAPNGLIKKMPPTPGRGSPLSKSLRSNKCETAV